MPKGKAASSSESSRKMRPALSPEARENQLVSLAVDLAEKQLREGTASSQVITHYLKLGSTKEKIYLRKDITSITRTSEQGDKTTYWTYQEAALTPQEFNEYTNLLMAENAIKGTNDSDNIVQIMAGQES